MTRRVAVYVDGFNLYYGLRSKGWRRYYWLDLRSLSEQLLRPGQRCGHSPLFHRQGFSLNPATIRPSRYGRMPTWNPWELSPASRSTKGTM